MYVLVIMLSIYGTDHRTAGGVSVESIKGFATQTECLNAARKLKYPISSSHQRISYSTSCLPMSL